MSHPLDDTLSPCGILVAGTADADVMAIANQAEILRQRLNDEILTPAEENNFGDEYAGALQKLAETPAQTVEGLSLKVEMLWRLLAPKSQEITAEALILRSVRDDVRRLAGSDLA